MGAGGMQPARVGGVGASGGRRSGSRGVVIAVCSDCRVMSCRCVGERARGAGRGGGFSRVRCATGVYQRGECGRRCQGLVVCWGVSAAGRSQEECRRGTGARRGVMNWNDSGGGGTFSRDRRGLLSPALVLANLPTFRLVGLLGSWWVVVRVLRSVSRKEGGERGRGEIRRRAQG